MGGEPPGGIGCAERHARNAYVARITPANEGMAAMGREREQLDVEAGEGGAGPLDY